MIVTNDVSFCRLCVFLFVLFVYSLADLCLLFFFLALFLTVGTPTRVRPVRQTRSPTRFTPEGKLVNQDWLKKVSRTVKTEELNLDASAEVASSPAKSPRTKSPRSKSPKSPRSTRTARKI